MVYCVFWRSTTTLRLQRHVRRAPAFDEFHLPQESIENGRGSWAKSLSEQQCNSSRQPVCSRGCAEQASLQDLRAYSTLNARESRMPMKRKLPSRPAVDADPGGAFRIGHGSQGRRPHVAPNRHAEGVLRQAPRTRHPNKLVPVRDSNFRRALMLGSQTSEPVSPGAPAVVAGDRQHTQTRFSSWLNSFIPNGKDQLSLRNKKSPGKLPPATVVLNQYGCQWSLFRFRDLAGPGTTSMWPLCHRRPKLRLEKSPIRPRRWFGAN